MVIVFSQTVMKSAAKIGRIVLLLTALESFWIWIWIRAGGGF